MNGSRYRLGLVVSLALVLTMGASACSKKDPATTTTASSTPTTAAAGKGTTTTAKATGGTAKANPCGTWSAGALGQPEASKAPETAGFFVWQDFLGWHLRARGTTSREPFKGTIRGSRDMGSVKEFPVGSGAKVELKGNLVEFEIPPSAELKGFDLIAGCQVDQLQFALLVGQTPAPVDSIYVGSQGKAVSPVFIQQKV